MEMMKKIERSFDSLLVKYSYLHLTRNDLLNIFNSISLEDSGSNNPCDLVEQELINITKEILVDADKDTIIDIFNEYIDNNFVTIHNYSDAFSCMIKLMEFIHKLKFELEPNLIISLIRKNIKLSGVLNVIANQKCDDIGNSKLGKIFTNNTAISFIELYCELNNITSYIDVDDDFEKHFESGKGNESYTLYLKDIGNIRVLTHDEQKEVALRMVNGDEQAFQQMINSNLRLVVSIAKKYASKDVPITDLIQEGNIGLMEAVKRYNPSLGYKFSTYATWWIKQAISKALMEQSKVVKTSTYIYGRVNIFRRIRDEIIKSEGREPTIGEIAEKMGTTVDRAVYLYNLDGDVISLNTSLGDDDDTELLDTLASPEEEVYDTVYRNLLPLGVRKVFETCNLTEREKEILRYRYGFDDGVPKTLNFIAKKFDLSRERVRQIEATALRKLRKPHVIKKIMNCSTRPDKTLADYASEVESITIGSKTNNTVSNTSKFVLPAGEAINFDKRFSMPVYFYQYFVKFTKSFLMQLAFDEIDFAVSLLSYDDMSILYRLFGNSLKDAYNNSNVSPKEEEYFISSIVPRIIYYLNEIYIGRDGKPHMDNMAKVLVR